MREPPAQGEMEIRKKDFSEAGERNEKQEEEEDDDDIDEDEEAEIILDTSDSEVEVEQSSSDEAEVERNQENDQPKASNKEKEKLHLSDQEYTDSDEEYERNPVGNIPIKWYEDFDHIGYDRSGKPLLKSKKMDEVDKLLAKSDDPYFRRTVYDEKNDEVTVLTDRELHMVQRILQSKYAEPSFYAEPEYIDYYTRNKEIMPLTNTPEPKRRFIPSKWERVKVLKIVQGIKQGHIKIGKPPAKKNKFYLLWGDDDNSADARETRKRKGPKHIPAPKVELPGHALSYRPPEEYLFNEDEEKEWKESDPEDRKLAIIPKRFGNLRSVPRYEDFVKESFERCLDLYLCARVEKHRLNIDPESLVPQLPLPQELRPYPTTLAQSYFGHTDYVYGLDINPSGHLLASAGGDGILRIWEVDTGKCIYTFNLHSIETMGDNNLEISKLLWNPQEKHKLLALALKRKILLVHVECDICNANDAQETVSLLSGSMSTAVENPSQVDVEWTESENIHVDRLLSQETAYVIMNIQGKSTSDIVDIAWHSKGQYLATTLLDSETKKAKILVHHISKRHSQNPFAESDGYKGRIQKTLFHPTKPILFVATQTHVLVYHLIRQVRLKKLSSGAKWISSMAIHPTGDNLIIGTYDRRVCWFDLDLSDKPFRTLKYHTGAIRGVDFHSRYPLFATCSDDGTVHVFHARVYEDLMRNPLIVPLKVLRAHSRTQDGFGVLNCVFHPKQPWIFTSGADGVVHMFQNIP